MKKILLPLSTLFMLPNNLFANPACAICTVAIGASLGIAQKLGVADSIVGLWAGALLTLLGYWTILFFDKKGWKFWGRDTLLILSSVAMIGFAYISEIKYTSIKVLGFLNIDPVLFGAILGMSLLILSGQTYEWMKAKNNGHAHFPFERVVLPFVVLMSTSVCLNYFKI